MSDAPKANAEMLAFCESCLDRFGPETPSAVGWFDGNADSRYRTMLGVIRPPVSDVTLLDFGCGLSHLYEFIRRNGVEGITYSGLDLSPRFIALSREKHPDVSYYELDVLDPAAPRLPTFDYVVVNGLFSYKGTMSDAKMFDYLQALVPKVFEIARVGVAFNVTSAQVEWTRDDLFHLRIDPLLDFLSRRVSRHVAIRHDYGLFEYTVYVYREPSDPARAGSRRLLESPPDAIRP